MASAISASTARQARASRTRTGSSVALPIVMGARAMMRTYSPIRSVRPKREHKSGEARKRWRLTASRGNLISPAQMAIRPILTLPDPILRKKAKPIERVDADLRRLMDDMLLTMYDAPGIGLAAPQIGILRRLIVMDPAKDEAPKTPVIMVNPEILERSDEMRVHDEGCLSIPDFTAEIERPAKTRVSFLDRAGKKQEIELNGIWSTLVQHEIDHLNGVLFIDYLSRLKRDRIVKKFTKAKRAEAL